MDGDRRNSDESFASVAEHAPVMLWRGDANGKCIYLNRAQRAFWGVPDDGVDQFSWATTLLAEDSDKVFGPFAEGMAAQRPFRCEARYRRADGAIRILETHAEPRFASDGTFTGMVGVNVDVTDQRAAQAELEQSETRLRTLADNLPFGMVYQIIRGADGSRRFSFVSSQCKLLNGVDAEAAMADASLLYGQIAPEFREAFAAAEAEASDALQPFEFETKIRRADGVERWFKMASAPRRLANGDTVWDGVQVDIHDIKVAEERRLLLMKEMSHRIKNNLSTVLSIAAQTGRSASSYAQFSASFQARLQALAKSHDLLMRDARDAAHLREILEAELLPYRADTARALSLTGEPVLLMGRTAISVALVIHELATNAAKYGAYTCDGAIEAAWTVDHNAPGRPVRLTWRERGGPPAAAPAKFGFGSRLIESLLRGQLGGDVVTRFTASGFEADLSFLSATE
ncbi:MAG: sensor histidine kinase [Hyphomonadaceae bacterium]